MKIKQESKEISSLSGTDQDRVLVAQASSAKRVISQVQLPTSTKSPVVGPTPITGPFLSQTARSLTGTSKLRPTPRLRSIFMAPIPHSLSRSRSARASPMLSQRRVGGWHHVTPTRQIIRKSESDDSGVADEQEAIQALIDDIPASACEGRANLRDDLRVPLVLASSSNASSGRSSPDFIFPSRRSIQYSSASSNDHVPLTDAESPPVSSPSPEPVETIESPSYGGFKALTWNSYKRNLDNFPFKHYSTKDIPTSLPDSINRLSAYTRRDAGIRDVFRAFMLENICDDEGSAPEIDIINEVDAEPSPVFEFHYSNRMWYGEDLTMPDYSKLKGCECIGRCDPKSRTCACARKTRSYLEVDGCVYEKNGRLKYPRYPIFECNDFCSCDEHCRNRVSFSNFNCALVFCWYYVPKNRLYNMAEKSSLVSEKLGTKDGVQVFWFPLISSANKAKVSSTAESASRKEHFSGSTPASCLLKSKVKFAGGEYCDNQCPHLIQLQSFLVIITPLGNPIYLISTSGTWSKEPI